MECLGAKASGDLLGPIKPRVAQALSGDNVTDTIKTVTAVILAVFAIRAVGAAYLTPTTHRWNAVITGISMSHGHYPSVQNSVTAATS